MRIIVRTIRFTRRSSQAGSALIEFAFASAFLLAIVGAAFDLGRVFPRSTQVNDAAWTGVQFALSDSTRSTDLQAVERAALESGISVPGLTATAKRFCTCGDGKESACGSGVCGSQRTYIEVLTSAKFETWGKWPLIPASIPLRGKAVARIQ